MYLAFGFIGIAGLVVACLAVVGFRVVAAIVDVDWTILIFRTFIKELGMKQRFGGTGPEHGLLVVVDVEAVVEGCVVWAVVVEILVVVEVAIGLEVVLVSVVVAIDVVLATIDVEGKVGFLVLRVINISIGEAMRTQVTSRGTG